jgi:hypothetical protein
VKLPARRRGARVVKPSGTAPKRRTRLRHRGYAVERGYGAVAFHFLPAAQCEGIFTLFAEAAGQRREGE